MNITPDDWIFWRSGAVVINATLVYSWVVMALQGVGAWFATRRFNASHRPTTAQNLAEVLVQGILDQIHEVTGQDPKRFLPFIGTLFIYIATCNALTIVPGYQPPTGSLSTTAALATCVFVAVPIFGISDRGVWGYLKTFLEPSPLMLPFNLLGEITRTVSLAIRLFGNIMSGSMIAATVLAVAPLIFPIFLNTLGLLIGLIQAYIFSILALVFIASATKSHAEEHTSAPSN